jgi:hypothetical protein
MNFLILSFFSQALAYTKKDFTYLKLWKERPKVVELCSDFPAPKDMVEEAIDFWVDSGIIDYKLEVVEVHNCDDEFHAGTIMITKQRTFDIEKYYAMAYHDAKGYDIFAARIEVDPIEYLNIILMVHELGHALGLKHEFEDEDHIMYPTVLSNPTRF